MKTFHVDGGAFIEPPKYIPHNAYFSVTNGRGKLVYFAKDIGDYTNNIAEYEAIKWVVDNIKVRPLKICSDSMTAMSWARKGGISKQGTIEPILLEGIVLEHKHANYADIWNSENHSPKQNRNYYYKRNLKKVQTDLDSAISQTKLRPTDGTS